MSPKHEPNDSYFYLEKHIDKFMITDDALNSHVDPVIMKTTGEKNSDLARFFYIQ